MQFDKYFSRNQIVKILCKTRAKSAKKIHDIHFHRNISSSAKSPNDDLDQIRQYFPSRKKWIRLTKKERHHRKLSAVEVNQIQLERTVKRVSAKVSKGEQTPKKWFTNLENFIQEVQGKALTDETYIIPNPTIIPAIKDEKKNIFRPIAVFNLREKIIIGQTAKYFIDLFDILFEDCSYAFRSSYRQKDRKRKQYTHHQAVEDIIAFKKKFQDKELWVAECDLQKFYDSVSHRVVKTAFDEGIKRLKELKPHIQISERAIHIFTLYLNSYTFNKHVQTLGKNYWENRKGHFAWVKHDDLRNVDSDPFYDCIGVPQGGALSCFIANLVLDYVDKKVIQKDFPIDKELFYARFCDDMVVIHTNKQKCQRALERYDAALTPLKLVRHGAVEIQKYDQAFWTKKSKQPYKWDSNEKNEANVPWLSFVGYQISFDNKIRVRPQSINKELHKQVQEAEKISTCANDFW